MYIKIYTLGRFALLRNGQPIRFTRKASNKPILLSKVIVSLGGRGVPKERVADALWPDNDGDKALQSLATTLHRLRKLLGNSDAVLMERGCLTLNRDLCVVDAWKFERLCGKADLYWEQGESDNAKETSKQAISLYNGNFLEEDLSEPWTVRLREKLRNKYIRCVGKLGHYLEETGNLELAVECYRKSLDIDGLDEKAYRRLMACYLRLGAKSEALSTYQRCKSVLLAGYGIQPSEETEILRNFIIEART